MAEVLSEKELVDLVIYINERKTVFFGNVENDFKERLPHTCWDYGEMYGEK